LNLRLRVLRAAAIGGFGTGAAAFYIPPSEVTVWYPWKAVWVFMAIMVAAVFGVEAHHPFPRLGPANTVTIVRAWLLAFVVALIGEPITAKIAWAGVMGASAVAVLDGADGWVARRTGMGSAFGARFDMELDALLILTLSVLVWQHGKAGGWVLICGMLRYAFVVATWRLEWMRRPLRPTFRGKTAAVVNMVGLTIALGPIIPVWFSMFAAVIATTTLVWSFGLDVRRLWRNEG
jgi:phosphatidylglycerophosphate synthase